MIFRQLLHHGSFTYTYLVACPDSRKGALIDPVDENIEQYMQLLGQLNIELIYACDTHVHADHITALGDLRERTGCVTVMGHRAAAECVSTTVRHGDRLDIGSMTLEVIDTPGHTDDSICYRMPDRVFTGDTLLIRGSGRTDFQNGDPIAAYHSLFDRLLTLPDDTLVYPAHDYKGWTVSTIGEEKAHNPRLQVSSAAEYAAIMNNLDLPVPTMMDVAVPANRACGEAPPAPPAPPSIDR